MWLFKKKQMDKTDTELIGNRNDNNIMAQCIRDSVEVIEMTRHPNPMEGLVSFTKPEEFDENNYAICRCIVAAALFQHRMK